MGLSGMVRARNLVIVVATNNGFRCGSLGGIVYMEQGIRSYKLEPRGQE